MAEQTKKQPSPDVQMRGKMEQALFKTGPDPAFPTWEAGQYVDTSGSIFREREQEPIFIDPRYLWIDFFSHSRFVKWSLGKYLDTLRAIQEASPPSSTASRGNKLAQFSSLPIFGRFRTTARSPPATSSDNIERDRDELVVLRKMAVHRLGEMDERLDIAKLLPKRTETWFQPIWTLWTAAFCVLAILAPNQALTNLSIPCATIGAGKLLIPVFRPIFLDYNLDCLQREVQSLKRKLEEGTVGEKNRKDLESWHMEIRDVICSMDPSIGPVSW